MPRLDRSFDLAVATATDGPPAVATCPTGGVPGRPCRWFRVARATLREARERSIIPPGGAPRLSDPELGSPTWSGEAKFRHLARTSAKLAALGAVLPGLLWAWDVVHHPAAARASFPFRLGMSLVLASYPVALRWLTSRRWLPLVFYASLYLAEVLFAVVCARTGASAVEAATGFVHAALLAALVAIAFPASSAIAGTLVAMLLPIALFAAQAVPNLDPIAFLAVAGPSCGGALVLAVGLERAHARIDGLRREAQRLARSDPLTGLDDRRELARRAEQILALGRRRGKPTALLVADIDCFKLVNDRHGHLVGDQVILAIADALRAAVRATDVVARVGGDEFIVLLPECPASDATVVAERIRDAVAAVRVPGAARVAVQPTLSIGVGAGTLDATLDDLIEAADRALYEAKALGRNQVRRTGEPDGTGHPTAPDLPNDP